MELPPDWESEVQLVAEDLFSNLMPKHPMFQQLPPFERNSDKTFHFSEALSKSVMLAWHMVRKNLEPKLRCDFPEFVMSDKAFRVYLVSLCSMMIASTSKQKDVSQCFPTREKVILFSAILLELLSFLYRRRVTHFVRSAPYYWLFIFKTLRCEKLYAEGGWKTLEILAEKYSESYEDTIEEIHHHFWGTIPPKLKKAKEINQIKATVSTESSKSSSYVSTDDLPANSGTTESNTLKKHKAETFSNMSPYAKLDLSKFNKVQEYSPVCESFKEIQISQNNPHKNMESDKSYKIKALILKDCPSGVFSEDSVSDCKNVESDSQSGHEYEAKICSIVTESTSVETCESGMSQEDLSVSKSFINIQNCKDISQKRMESDEIAADVSPEFSSWVFVDDSPSCAEVKSTDQELEVKSSSNISKSPEINPDSFCFI